MSAKPAALRVLAQKRIADRQPPHLCLADIHGGFYECPDFVSPWSRSAHNDDAAVMIVAQDWASEDYLANKPPDERMRDLGYDPDLVTNRNLQRLLADAFGLSFAEVFATNLFPFIKRGRMNKSIPDSDCLYCAREYALPQIAVVRPKLVLCIGLGPYRALRRAAGFALVGTDTALSESGAFEVAGARVVASYHTGGQGTLFGTRLPELERIWREHATWLRAA